MTFTRNKYNAIKQTYKGEIFDSKKELNRFMELEILLRARKISDLELHPKFDLMVNGVKIGRYTADFRYKKGSVIKPGSDVTVIKADDVIYYDKNAGHSMLLDNESMTIIQERDVVVVL